MMLIYLINLKRVAALGTILFFIQIRTLEMKIYASVQSKKIRYKMICYALTRKPTFQSLISTSLRIILIRLLQAGSMEMTYWTQLLKCAFVLITTRMIRFLRKERKRVLTQHIKMIRCSMYRVRLKICIAVLNIAETRSPRLRRRLFRNSWFHKLKTKIFSLTRRI